MSRTKSALVGLGLVTLGLLVASPRVEAQDPEVVIEWNQLLQATIPTGITIASPRYYAMLHVAMFDAINAIDGSYSPFRVNIDVPIGASADAAAAQAGHDILVALIPASQETYDAALAARLATLPAGPANQGVRVGQTVARRIILWRRTDGSNAPRPTYVLPPLPGLWQPTPPAFAPAGFTHFPDVKPFAILSTTQFLPDRPPTLTSASYAANLNETKRVGSVNSTVRTEAETQAARLWAGVITRTTLFALWNNVARDTARSQFLSQVDTARLFALMNVSQHDALLTSQTSKFVYGLWRPVTAIQRADEDLNPATQADPDWLPLLTTPPYPSHSGNMACAGASAARALALGHGTDEIAFTATWFGLPATDTTPATSDVSRNYTSFWRMALDEARSRIVGGIHYTFESRASQRACPKVSEFVFNNYMVPN